MLSILKEIYEESKVPRHDCTDRYYDHGTRIKAPTALDLLKQDAVNEAVGLKENSKALTDVYVGVRAVFARDEQGKETEIIGYRVFKKELFLKPAIRTIDHRQYLLPKSG